MKHPRGQSLAETLPSRQIRLKPDPTLSLTDPRAAQQGSFLSRAVLIFLLALAVRLLHVWQIRGAPFFTMLLGDARGYDEWARRIAGGEWLGGDVFYQAPLYPYFLGTIYAVMGRDLLVVRIVQALVGSAACTLLGLAAARLFSARAGLVAGLGLALYAPAIFFDGLIQKSVLDVFFVCLALWLMSRIIEDQYVVSGFSRTWSGFSRTGRNFLGLGLAMGGLALTRENAMVLVAVILVWAVIGSRQSPTVRLKADTTYRTAAFLLGLSLVLTPVAVRNNAVGGGFYVTTSQFGPNFFIGNNPRSDGTYRSLRFGRGAPEYERQDATELAEHALGRKLTPSEVSSYWTDRATAFITSQPGAWLALVGKKFFLLWNADEMLDTESQETYAEWSLPLRLGSWIGHFGVLLPLALFGVWATWPDRRRLWVFYAMTLAYSLSVVMFYVFARYRFPLVPFLMLFGAAGISAAPRFVWANATRTEAPAAMPSGKLTRGEAGGAGRDATLKDTPERYRARVSAVVALVTAATVFTNWPVLSKPLMQAITENNLAVAFQEEGRLDEAIAHYRRSIELRSDYAPAHNNLGAALRAKGEVDEAVASYQRALQVQPEYADAHYNLANALLENKPAEAAAHFRIALQSIPGSAGVRNNLGIALANEGKLDEAVSEFRAALQAEPDSAKTSRNLGRALSEMGRPLEGIPYLRRAIELDPNDREAHYDLGGELLEMDQLEEAAKEFQAALALAPDWAEAHNNLGIALASLGRVDDAITEFQQALQLQPDFADAKQNLAMTLAQKRQR